MPARTGAPSLCARVFASPAHLMQAQEATSANLPDQFQTGEMIQIHKPKKRRLSQLRKSRRRLQSKTLHLYPSSRWLQKKGRHRWPQW